ncbi:nitrilase [Sulfolobales archaeon HS-7]|nr:nitrilase [Sulfolobales archaeon HS-7]
MLLIAVTFMRMKSMGRRHNIEKAKRLLKNAREKGAKLIILPSMFPVGNVISLYDNERRARSLVKNLSEKIRGNSTDSLINLAIEGELYVLAGPILEQAGPKIFLTSVFISPQGEILGKYRKLAPSEREMQLGLSAGKEPVTFTLDKKYGIIAEDDIFMPEISRILTISGCSAILGSARTVESKPDHIKHVAITRAIENGIPMLIAGGVLEDDNGDERLRAPSFIISSEGDLIREAADDDTLLSIDSSVLFRAKEIAKYPTLESVITGLYKSLKKNRMTSKGN